MTNLLPQREIQERRSAYTNRFLSALFAGLASAAFIGVLALLPAYITARGERQSIEFEVQALEAIATTESEGMSDRNTLTVARMKADELGRLLSRENIASDVLRAALDVRVLGIAIEGAQLTFKNDTYTLRLQGALANRSQLQEYIAALESLGIFTSVHIPVAALASADSGEFIIQVIGDIEV